VRTDGLGKARHCGARWRRCLQPDETYRVWPINNPSCCTNPKLMAVDERVGLEATTENQSWIAVEPPTVRNPGSSFASHRRHRRE